MKKKNFMKNTIKSSVAAWRTFIAWHKVAKDSDFVFSSKDKFISLLCEFIPSARQEDGTEYKSRSLKTIVRSIIRYAYLHYEPNQENIWNFQRDNCFFAARNVLNRKMGILQAMLCSSVM